MSKRRKIAVFNESLWEEYVWKYPEKFLNRPLKKFKRQWKLPTAGRPDLVFKCDDGRLLLVEIQLKALDRNHFFKTFEYQLEIQEITKKPVDILILCNTINERKKFLKVARDIHDQNIELVVISEDRVIKIIQEIAPHLEIQNSKKISLKDKLEATLTDREKRITEIYRTELDRLKTEMELKEREVENLKFASLPKFISKHVEQKENYDNEFVWKRELFKRIQQVVEPFETGFLKKERVFCPLCEYSPEGYYMEPIGFSYPTGFERHIFGTHNVSYCPVTKRAIELVMPYFDQRSDQQQKDKELKKDQRRLEEHTYLISPNETPLLIDEGLFGYGTNGFKSASDLELAEERLKQLAFRKELEDKTIKFVRDVKEYSVFADPRLKDRIVFRVFKRSIQRERVIYKPLKRRKIVVGGGDFYILDSWKNIAVIFNKRFSQLVKQ